MSCAQYFKDTIQKQFTTQRYLQSLLLQLCSIFQRYNSKAIHNSIPEVPDVPSVVLNISKIQFKSNSQPGQKLNIMSESCAQYFKDTIQKQFTTKLFSCVLTIMLCSIFQRYNSKAIHNAFTRGTTIPEVVLNISKIQFKSNSQLDTIPPRILKSCAQYFKDTIQKQFTTFKSISPLEKLLCSIFQRYNSKAIHNAFTKGCNYLYVVLNISKIQFKSNSQLKSENDVQDVRCAQYFKDTIQKQFTTIPSKLIFIVCCAQYFKDTIQKQFTTQLLNLNQIDLLCSIFQRYNSKAIHNFLKFIIKVKKVVLNISKIQFKSNSQLPHNRHFQDLCCAQYFKDTIQKQFTTCN